MIEHCGKPAVLYAKPYGCPRPHSIELGFACQVCGEHRIPTGRSFSQEPHVLAMDVIRENGIQFDASLCQ